MIANLTDYWERPRKGAKKQILICFVLSAELKPGRRPCFGLADGYQRDALVLLVSSHPLGAGVELWLSVHQKQISVVAVFKLHGGHPCAIGSALHWIGFGIPSIEVAHKAYLFGLWGDANEVHWFDNQLVALLFQGAVSFHVKIHFPMHSKNIRGKCTAKLWQCKN